MNILILIKRLFVPKSYLLRHDIIELLGEKWNLRKHQNQEDYYVNEKKLLEKFKNYELKYLQNHLTTLKDSKEIDSFCDKENELSYMALPKGLESYLERKFINEGVSKRLVFVSDILKNIVAIFVILGFFEKCLVEKENKEIIQKLEKRMNSLENKKNIKSKLVK